MNAELKTVGASNALTVVERAALALNSSEHEKNLIAMAERAKGILLPVILDRTSCCVGPYGLHCGGIVEIPASQSRRKAAQFARCIDPAHGKGTLSCKTTGMLAQD
jgi:hypothetical protein